MFQYRYAHKARAETRSPREIFIKKKEKENGVCCALLCKREKQRCLLHLV